MTSSASTSGSTSSTTQTPARTPSDAFEDARPARPQKSAPSSWRPSTAVLVVAASVGIAVLVGVTGWRVLLVLQLALAVVVGTLIERPWRVAAAVAAAGAVGVLLGLELPLGTRLVVAAGFVVVVAGFVALPRALVGRAIADVRATEQARADAEVLRLLDDAQHFRRLGGTDDDDAATLKDVAGAVAQRDRLYRLLGLIERGLRDVDGVALYVLDDRGTHLRLVEQRHRVHSDIDVDNHSTLALGARGVGPAGLLGLALQRKAPLRVVDHEGTAVRAHRRTGPAPQSTLCVPLLAAGGSAATGVLVVDRVAPVAFTDDDEAFVRAAAAEVLDGLATEALFDALDAERRRTERVFAAARALAGVTRAADVQRTAALAIGELCAGVAIVDVDGRNNSFVVGHAAGLLAPLDGHRGTLEASSFAARVLVEGVPLPHTALEKATPRPLLGSDPVTCADLGDLRVVPLLAAGEAHGLIVVATRPGERLRKEVVDAVVAIADVLALALASARAFDAVERKATTDGLTGVWNRRTLDEKLVEAVARARRSGAPLCVMITDVDHFKSVNDTWGHATGDEVLKGVARSLQAQARTTDIVARLGGEEFVVVCEATDIAGATIVAERMRLALKALQFATPKGPLSVTSSFGVARLLPDDNDGHPTLEHADKQLYKAKQQGRDRVVAD